MFLCAAVLMVSTLSGLELAWDSQGLPVFQGADLYWTGQTVKVDENHILVLWCDARNGNRDVFGRMIDGNGNPVWDEDLLIAGGDLIQSDPACVIASDGNILISWVERGVIPAEDPLYLKKITPAGATVWASEAISTTGNLVECAQLIPDPTGGAFVCWQESTTQWTYSIFAAHIDDTGHNVWTEGGIPLTGRAEFTTRDHYFAMTSDNDGGIFVMYKPDGYSTIYLRNLAGDGTLLQTQILASSTTLHSGFQLVRTADGMFNALWTDSGVLQLYRFDSQGTIQAIESWDFGYDHYMNHPEAIADGTNIFLHWLVGTGSSETLRISADGTIWPVVTLPYLDPICGSQYSGLTTDGMGGCYVSGRIESNGEPHLCVSHITDSGTVDWTSCLDDANNSKPFYLSLVHCDDHVVTIGNQTCELTRSINVNTVSATGLVREQQTTLVEKTCANVISSKAAFGGGISAVVFTTQVESANYRVHLQLIRSDGSFVLPVNGRIIGSLHEYDNYDIAVDSEGNTGILHQGDGQESTSIVFTEFDRDGNLLTALSLYGYSSFNFLDQITIQAAGIRDFELTWIDQVYVPSEIFFQNLVMQQRMVDGQPLFAAPGQIVDLGYIDNLYPFDIFGPYMIWGDVSDYYISKLDGEGHAVEGWPIPGVAVPRCTTDAYPHYLVSIEDGGLMYVNGANSENLGYISPTGELETGRFPDYSEGGFYDLAMIDNSPTYLWQNTIGDNTYTLRRLDRSRNLLTSTPLPLLSSVYYNEESTLYPVGLNGQDGALLLNRVYQTDQCMFGTMMVTSFDTDGNIVTESTYITPSTLHYNISSTPTADGAMFCWTDARIEADENQGVNLYAQRIVLPVTVSRDDDVNAAPMLTLSNYPNPFNPSTTIAYSLPTTGDTTLRIYNTRGQMVKTLLRESMDAGNHSVTWDGTDDSGNPVGSGVYLYRLQRGSLSSTNKCLLLK
jgi:hypothetical protein